MKAAAIVISTKGDARRGVDTNQVVRSEHFYAPLEKKANGEWKMKGGQIVYVCFSSDFFVEDADPWRAEAWADHPSASGSSFSVSDQAHRTVFHRSAGRLGCGLSHVTIGCTVENQRRADERLALLATLPIAHKNIICQPMLEAMDLEKWLRDETIELVVAGGNRTAAPAR